MAQLKLNADWVVFSACNTIGRGRARRGASGLARALFYADVRALLASHWAVESNPAMPAYHIDARHHEIRCEASAFQVWLPIKPTRHDRPSFGHRANLEVLGPN